MKHHEQSDNESTDWTFGAGGIPIAGNSRNYVWQYPWFIQIGKSLSS
jgi:hypothetical protein